MIARKTDLHLISLAKKLDEVEFGTNVVTAMGSSGRIIQQFLRLSTLSLGLAPITSGHSVVVGLSIAALSVSVRLISRLTRYQNQFKIFKMCEHLVNKFNANKEHILLVKEKFDNICWFGLEIEKYKYQSINHDCKYRNANHLPELWEYVRTLSIIRQDLGNMQKNNNFIRRNDNDEDEMNVMELDTLVGLVDLYDKTHTQINALLFSIDNDDKLNIMSSEISFPDTTGSTGSAVASGLAHTRQVMDMTTRLLQK